MKRGLTLTSPLDAGQVRDPTDSMPLALNSAYYGNIVNNENTRKTAIEAIRGQGMKETQFSVLCFAWLHKVHSGY